MRPAYVYLCLTGSLNSAILAICNTESYIQPQPSIK